MQRRWPLHPEPHPYETLERYVRRLAQCYGTTYKNFCLHALGMPLDDSDSRLFRKPTHELLQRLSNDTGIAIELFEQMTLRCIWSRLIVEMTQYTETLEGQAQLALWRDATIAPRIYGHSLNDGL